MKLISYWNIPLLSGTIWLATLLGLLIRWTAVDHRELYVSMETSKGQTIAYISDVGADVLKPLFVTGCILTSVLLNLSFTLDYYLRHKGRLVPNTSMGGKIRSVLTIVFATIGMVGLCFLSGFDTKRYRSPHLVFLMCFMVGYLLSAILICWDYQRLGSRNRDHRILRTSFWVKLAFVLVEFALIIVFVGFQWTDRHNTAAIFEWTIAFVFSFYIFSFCIDLYPAVRTRNSGFLPSHISNGAHTKYATPGQMEESIAINERWANGNNHGATNGHF